MATIATNRGALTDREFETLAQRDLTALWISSLPVPHQLELLLRRYGVAPTQAEWAHSIALRALTKLVVGGRPPAGHCS